MRLGIKTNPADRRIQLGLRLPYADANKKVTLSDRAAQIATVPLRLSTTNENHLV